jgi:hypothetical protein
VGDHSDLVRTHLRVGLDIVARVMLEKDPDFVLIPVGALRSRHPDHLGDMTRNDPSPIVRTGVVSLGAAPCGGLRKIGPMGAWLGGPECQQ